MRGEETEAEGGLIVKTHEHPGRQAHTQAGRQILRQAAVMGPFPLLSLIPTQAQAEVDIRHQHHGALSLVRQRTWVNSAPNVKCVMLMSSRMMWKSCARSFKASRILTETISRCVMSSAASCCACNGRWELVWGMLARVPGKHGDAGKEGHVGMQRRTLTYHHGLEHFVANGRQDTVVKVRPVVLHKGFDFINKSKTQRTWQAAYLVNPGQV